jgi:DNA polymerase-1
MGIKATTQDAYQLLHEGSLVMAEMEANGIRVDVDYIKRTQRKMDVRIGHLTERLKKDEIYKVWKDMFGWKMKLGSRTQLASVLFDKMGLKSNRQTATRAAADADALESLDVPFVNQYLHIEKLKKARSTYLANILFETVDGFIHPNFNLHLARTYRGSSDHPNFQNIPMRDALIKKLIRRSFIARPGHCLVDLDFKGSEVNAASWYHKDPVMLKYIATNPGKMHFDAAMQIYKLPAKLMTADIRYSAKNKFVFPEFYGDWWISCARNLWNAIDKMNLKTANDIPLKKWLAKKGIKSLGTGDPKNIGPKSFEAHLKNVEYDFWHNRFAVYQEWKEEWWEKYQERGWFQMLSGFRVSGYLNRKEVINYPVQGTAFHALLWCLIRISYLLKKYKMKTKLIGQIHDDAVSDVPEKELSNYIEIALDVITVQLKKHWPWIITPMQVEIETTPIDGSWYEKKLWEG